MNLTTLVTLIGELTILAGVIIPVLIFVRKLAEGQKCQLRSEMLKIYYRNCEKETIHQYEYENFSMLYNAYKALGGNSFIDKLWRDVQSWDIVAQQVAE
jgi:hypothetical protein